MASPFDLANLGDLKRWLDVAGTDDDDLLAALITRLSRAILNVLDRPSILPTIYNEEHDGACRKAIVLRQWPVISMFSCSVNGISIPASPALGSGVPAQPGYVLDPPEIGPPGRMQRLSLRFADFGSGVQNVRLSYSAGYQITNEAALVPSIGPYSLSVAAPYGAFASDGGVTYVDGTPFTVVASNPGSGQYTVQDSAYTFSAADTGTAVLITYGYVPADLSSCCIEWASERYAYRSRIGQRSKSLGGQETVAFIVGDVPDYVARVLNPYKRVVMP